MRGGATDGGTHYRVYTSGGPGGGGIPDEFAQFFSGASGGRGHAREERPRRPTREERKVRASDGSILVQRGHDLYSDLRLTVDQAILGTVAQVPTLTGSASVRVPPGTSSGVKLRLRGQGATAPGGGRGSHFVTVHIDVPKHVDDEAKKLLAEFMKKTKKSR
jgi:DnaJ-class molecular chaperone